MDVKVWKISSRVALAMYAGWAGQAGAQTSEVKEKPTLYTYVADWNIPREKWADMEKPYAGTQKMMDKAVADGTIVGYGSDVTRVHQGGGSRTTIGRRPCRWPACSMCWTSWRRRVIRRFGTGQCHQPFR